MKKILATCSILLITSFAYGCKNENPETDIISDQEETVEEGGAEEVSEETTAGLEEVEKYEEILNDDASTAENCSEIENAEVKLTCEQKFIYEKAVGNKDATMCEQLENQTDQESCVSDVSNGL